MRKIGLAISIFIACLCTGCGRFMPDTVPANGEGAQEKVLTIELLESEMVTPAPEEDIAAPTETPVTEFDDPAQWPYAYEQLDEASKSWYRGINASLLAMETEPVSLSQEGLQQGLTEENIDLIFQCVLMDHPEYFYVTGYQYTKYTRGDELVNVEFTGTYPISREEAVSRKAVIEERAAALLEGIGPEATEYEKVCHVYESIIQNTEYDMEAPDNQNIYSVLAGGASVCQGYAKTAQFLLNRLGVHCTMVQGFVKDGEGHAWNLVQVDGQYYYMDPTWGDASYQVINMDTSNVRIPNISYDYLCVAEDVLFRTHVPESIVPMPPCLSMDANYYVREGCYFTAYDEEQIRTLLQRVLAQRCEELHFKCADEVVYKTFKENLIDKEGIFDYLGDAYSTVAYTQNDQAFLLTFWMTNG